MAYPSVCKATLCFQQEAYGWTESYYRDNPSSNLQAELALAETLATKRIAMSGAQTEITHLKVSREDFQRDVLLSEKDWNGDAGQTSDAPDTAVLIKRYGTDNRSVSSLYLRGIWDALVRDGGRFWYNNPGWTPKYDSWVNTLTSNAWGFIGRVPGSTQKKSILTLNSDANGRVIITCAVGDFAPLTIGAKYKMFVSGCTGAASVNGPQVVTVQSNAAVLTQNRIPFFPYTGGGSISYNTLSFIPFTRFVIERVVERKAGRPLFLSAGKRPARSLA